MEGEVKTVEEWKTHILPALKSKQSEFQLIGYTEATQDEIWKCLINKVWKGNPEKKLYEVVQDIFHLPATTYMSFMTMSALQVEEDKDDIMVSINALTQSNEK